jgi:heme oxygenase (mycobilin-producing)
MLIRIVRMSFDPEKIETFLSIFKESKHKIASFDGCQSVELLQDVDHPNVYYTYSIWKNKESLENYRNSSLFAGVWEATKKCFNDKPKAYSLQKTGI